MGTKKLFLTPRSHDLQQNLVCTHRRILVNSTDMMTRDRLQSMEKFRNGEIDIDNLCSELRSKAKCSEGGAVVDRKDVDKILGAWSFRGNQTFLGRDMHRWPCRSQSLRTDLHGGASTTPKKDAVGYTQRLRVPLKSHKAKTTRHGVAGFDGRGSVDLGCTNV